MPCMVYMVSSILCRVGCWSVRAVPTGNRGGLSMGDSFLVIQINLRFSPLCPDWRAIYWNGESLFGYMLSVVSSSGTNALKCDLVDSGSGFSSKFDQCKTFLLNICQTQPIQSCWK